MSRVAWPSSFSRTPTAPDAFSPEIASHEFVLAIVKLDELDDIIAVRDGVAILMAQKLAHHGLAVGVSSGANFVGAFSRTCGFCVR